MNWLPSLASSGLLAGLAELKDGIVMKRILLIFIIFVTMLLSACTTPITISPTITSTPTSTPTITQIPAYSPTHNFPIVDIVKDSQYWNSAWEATGLYYKLWSINQSYRKTHTYIKGVYDCDDMTIDLWYILHNQGITSVIIAGNLDLDKERFRECDHTWLLIEHSRDGLYQIFIIESTNGEVYAFDLKTKAFAQYLYGYYYSSPSNFKEDNQGR